jgi:GNAT superfamily N-acetyltransferase
MFMTWQRLFKRRSSLAKEYGVIHANWLTFRYVLRRTLSIDWQKTILFERSLAEPIKEVIPRIKVNIRQATIDDLVKLKDMVDTEKYTRFQQRLDQGNICFLALDEDKVAAFSWISFHNEYLTESRIEVKLKDKEAYFFDTFVDPVYRNNGLQAAMIPARLKYLRELGFEKVIGLVDDDNSYSLKALASAGYKPKKVSTLIKIFGLKIHRWKDIVGESDGGKNDNIGIRD